jgi:phosphonate transport system permease protein
MNAPALKLARVPMPAPARTPISTLLIWGALLALESIRATGARTVEEIIYGVIPQALPLWISCALYRFESNVRLASVVGMVGAGGVGMVLWDVIRAFQYAQTATLLLMLVVSVSIIDLLSAPLRKRWT